MAPVKKPTATVQRETRSTRAAAITKKKATKAEKAEKAVTSPPAEKETITTKASSTIRKTRKATEEQEQPANNTDIPAPSSIEPPQAKSTRVRASKSTADAKTTARTTTGLAAAPRRRIKVTPLDKLDSRSQDGASEEPGKESAPAKIAKKVTRRAQNTVEEAPSESVQDLVQSHSSSAPPARRTTKASSTTTTERKEDLPSSQPEPKSRGRPKKATTKTPNEEMQTEQPTISGRVTRIRAASAATTSQTVPEALVPAPVTRKKVTFQDILDDGDKENHPLRTSKSKKATSDSSTGIRAKPLRKALTTTRTRKTVADKTKSAAAEKDEDHIKRMPSVLTPKKITQVARACTPDEMDEDELSGGKTPVRDLAMSPKRPTDPAFGRAISPVRRVDLKRIMVDQSAVGGLETQPPTGALASPARRPPASPFKDALKSSPKKNDAIKLLFPSHSEGQPDIHASLALNPSNLTSASQQMPNLLASPKRSGVLDPNFFSQSAMKPSTNKSPLKTSLLASPARRLFSPAKKTTASAAVKISEMILDNSEDEDEGSKEPANVEIESDLVVSSQFRASVSPARPLRLSRCHEDGMDFDESVLPVASPLKIPQSPAERISSQAGECSEEIASGEDNAPQATVETLDHGEQDDQEVVHISQVENVTVPDEQPAEESVEEAKGDNDELTTVLYESQPSSIADQVSRSLDANLGHAMEPLRAGAFDTVHHSSDDESVGNATPVQRLPKQRKSWAGKDDASRLSLGVPLSADGKGFGFTPLADQMDGWLASSPEKATVTRKARTHRDGSFEFSPLAAQHIDGKVIISRNSTPVQKLDLRKSMARTSTGGSALKPRHSLGVRRSVADRQSLAAEIPARDTQFEEYMEMRALEQESAALHEDSIFVDQAGPEFDEVIDINGADEDADDVNGDTVLIDHLENQGTVNPLADLTTDLVNSVHATDTAVVDFQELAAEADELAATVVEYSAESPILQPTVEHLESPSMPIIDTNSPIKNAPQPENAEVEGSLAVPAAEDTPIRPAMDFNITRMFNTVVSKVPLKPEGAVSPIKMPKKRSRSFGNNDISPNKRLSFGSLKQIAATTQSETVGSPDRRVRTSAAPSPGGTSTPASRYSRASFGDESCFTTPDQMSFAVDDFGDSTLDGIEIPEDFDASRLLQIHVHHNSPAVTEQNFDGDATPRQSQQKTPATARSSVGQAITPATQLKSTKRASRTSGSRQSLAKMARTPLGAIGKGVLDGAVIFVDVHTSEGADASGVFVELLAQMGARCVKDWRWNPRASLASAENEDSRIGITHVVYKDGGKRTLEKVRDTKGEVWCVGVAWVLDCERENKWLDEASYAIDAAILPRGGSKRRKSMEPRALLLNGDGSLSANKARRSVSAEVSELMKRELINTPIRHRVSSDTNNEDDDENEDVDNAATPTGFVAYDPRVAMTPGTPYLVSQGKKIVQMSAPPKQQTGKRLFEDVDDEDDGDSTFQKENEAVGGAAAVRDAKKFRMKNLDLKARRRTMNGLAVASGLNRPAIGSPLAKI